MRRRDLVLGLVALLLTWQAISMIVNEPILPGPLIVGQTFFQELGSGLTSHFLVSTGRVLAGVLLAVLLAAPAGIMLGQSPRLNQIFSRLTANLGKNCPSVHRRWCFIIF